LQIQEIFNIRNAKSSGFENYKIGNVPFVTNGYRNNGIIGYVQPNNKDRVFNKLSICISAFCEATVQYPPFLPRGNGGSGLLVLEPKNKMTFNELVKIAAFINNTHKWRFSFGRMVNRERIEHLDVNISDKVEVNTTISKLMPEPRKSKKLNITSKFKLFPITKLFNLEHGQFHALDKLNKGNYPTVSRVTFDNGIVGFYNKPLKAKVYPKSIITVSTTSGDAFIQLDEFIATDNVVILLPKDEYSLEFLLFVSAMINKEKWRISYGRQCYKTIFSKTNIFLPINKDETLNYKYINRIVTSSYNFNMVEQYLS